MFLIYPFFILGSIITTLMAYIVNPIIPLFADKDGNCPKYLYYFQTFDMPLPPNYWDAVKWLYRNPAYGFDLFVFGIDFFPEDWVVVKNTDTMFFAYDRVTGAFTFKHEGGKYLPAMKLGWKVFWFRREDGSFSDGKAAWNNWLARAPFCFTFMKA